MADIKLALQIDANNPIVGDIYLENGSPRLTNSLAEEVAQLLYIRFRFFKGEWFLDPAQGFPFMQSVLGVKTPLKILEQIFRNAIATCPGVASIDQFSISRTSDRKLSLEFNVRLKDNTTLSSSDFGRFIVETP